MRKPKSVVRKKRRENKKREKKQEKRDKKDQENHEVNHEVKDVKVTTTVEARKRLTSQPLVNHQREEVKAVVKAVERAVGNPVNLVDVEENLATTDQDTKTKRRKTNQRNNLRTTNKRK